jgi:hypothetical protein
MIDETKVKFERTVYKSGKVCYIATYNKINKKLVLNIHTLDDLISYDQFAMKELLIQINNEVEKRRR